MLQLDSIFWYSCILRFSIQSAQCPRPGQGFGTTSFATHETTLLTPAWEEKFIQLPYSPQTPLPISSDVSCHFRSDPQWGTTTQKSWHVWPCCTGHAGQLSTVFFSGRLLQTFSFFFSAGRHMPGALPSTFWNFYCLWHRATPLIQKMLSKRVMFRQIIEVTLSDVVQHRFKINFLSNAWTVPLAPCGSTVGHNIN